MNVVMFGRELDFEERSPGHWRYRCNHNQDVEYPSVRYPALEIDLFTGASFDIRIGIWFDGSYFLELCKTSSCMSQQDAVEYCEQAMRKLSAAMCQFGLLSIPPYVPKPLVIEPAPPGGIRAMFESHFSPEIAYRLGTPLSFPFNDPNTADLNQAKLLAFSKDLLQRLCQDLLVSSAGHVPNAHVQLIVTKELVFFDQWHVLKDQALRCCDYLRTQSDKPIVVECDANGPHGAVARLLFGHA